jgi:hypothetical protein
VVEDVEKVEMGTFELSSPGCDHTSDMHERITKSAFPKLYRALYGREEEPSEDELKVAVHAELELLVSADWRKAARGSRRISSARSPSRCARRCNRSRTSSVDRETSRPVSAAVS